MNKKDMHEGFIVILIIISFGYKSVQPLQGE